MTVVYAREAGLNADEFMDILRRSGLAARRPVDESDRIQGMAANANLIVSARDPAGRLIGVARSVTDFTYCCYLSDLAVDAGWQKKGVGRELIARTRKEIHPKALLLLLAAPAAMDYYPRIGMEKLGTCFAFPRRS